MSFFGIGGLELVIILVFAFLLFGPDKLPGVIKNISHIWNQIKGLRAQADQVIQAEVVEPLKDIEAQVNPLVAEGKSVTDNLASKLGIKSEPAKKTTEKDADKTTDKDTVNADDAKTEDSSKVETSAEAGAAASVSAAGTAAAADKTTTKDSAKEAAGTESKKPEQKPDADAKAEDKPKPKQKAKTEKTESFAEKKARLEREHRQKQKAADADSSDSSEKASDPKKTEEK